MALVYKLYYVLVHGDDEDYTKLGIYSSAELAKLELERQKGELQFNSEGGRLTVCPCEFDFVWWGDGFGWSDDVELADESEARPAHAPRFITLPTMQPPEPSPSSAKIFTLRHTIVRAEDDIDHKEIGNFSSEPLAKQAMERVADKPGFKDPRGYFEIQPSWLDVYYGVDGPDQK